MSVGKAADGKADDKPLAVHPKQSDDKPLAIHPEQKPIVVKAAEKTSDLPPSKSAQERSELVDDD